MKTQQHRSGRPYHTHASEIAPSVQQKRYQRLREHSKVLLRRAKDPQARNACMQNARNVDVAPPAGAFFVAVSWSRFYLDNNWNITGCRRSLLGFATP